MKNLYDHLGRLGAFALIGHGLTLVSLAATLIVVSPGLAADMGGTRIAWLGAVGIALVLDVAWIGALRMLARSLADRDNPVAAVSGAMVAAAAGGSSWALHMYGGALLYSLPPLVAMAFLAVDVWAGTRLSGAETAAGIRELRAQVRDERAKVRAGIHALNARAELAALRDTADMTATALGNAAHARALAAAQVVRMDTTADVRDTLAKAAKKTGVDIPQELPEGAHGRGVVNRGESLIERSTTPTGASWDTGWTPVRREPAMTDDALEQMAWTVLKTTEPPVSQSKFVTAMKDAGFVGDEKRLRALYKRLAPVTPAP